MLVALGPSFPCMRKQLARGNSWRFYRSYSAGSSSGFELFRKPGAWNNNIVRRSAVRGLHTVDRFVTYPLCIRLSIVSFYMILNKFDYMPTGDKSGEQTRAHGTVRSDTLQQRGRALLQESGNIWIPANISPRMANTILLAAPRREKELIGGKIN